MPGGGTGRARGAILAGAWLGLSAAAPPLAFVPLQSGFAASAETYRARWEADGARISAALESAAGIPFPAEPIEVLVRDGAPMTTYDGRTIRLRAGYPLGIWRATMAHELGHRLAQRLGRLPGIDDHRALYLFLYDALTDLYGHDFADRIVAGERRFRDAYDYDSAWRWALAMSREERQALLRRLRGD